MLRDGIETAETFPSDDGALDLGHIHLTAVGRRVVELQLPQQLPRLGGLEGIIQGARQAFYTWLAHCPGVATGQAAGVGSASSCTPPHPSQT